MNFIGKVWGQAPPLPRLPDKEVHPTEQCKSKIRNVIDQYKKKKKYDVNSAGLGTRDTDKRNFPYFDIVDRVLGDLDVISNRYVVDLGATAVLDVEKPERRIVSVLSEKQNVRNEKLVPKHSMIISLRSWKTHRRKRKILR